MAGKITLEFPDGTRKEFPKGITAQEIAAGIGQRLAKDALSAKLGERVIELDLPIEEGGKFRILTWDDEDGKKSMWHTGAHVLAEAVTSLYKDAKNTIGPPVDEGFYQDFFVERPFTPDDLAKIEKRMDEILHEKKTIVREVVDKKKALAEFGWNSFKQELIEEFAGAGKTITLYKQGKFTDLCKGGHVSDTGKIGAVKLLKVSSAYWRGDAKRESLQRIYGIAFPKAAMLEQWVKQKEEAEKRGHLRLGKELDLFSMQQEAPGTAFFHKNGTAIWNELIKFAREEQGKRGYIEVITPLIMKKGLWLKSGHWEHYRENMYFTNIDGEEYAVKPMNCPGHTLIYADSKHSYRELPIRMSEFGMVHRHELSGVLNGLLRVRKFTQDDAHIFCTPEQIGQEVKGTIELVDYYYRTFGFEYSVELSTRPENSMGSDDDWQNAESALKNALDSTGVEYKINAGDGAFYGPKIDFHIRDSLGRRWQLATVQLDFQMPQKFGLAYTGKDDKERPPVMIHRAIFGALERFMAILIEHYAGAFPLWLAPVQVKVISVSEKYASYAGKVHSELSASGIRSELDVRPETVGYKVREAQGRKVPFIVNVGEKEEQAGTVAVRSRDNKVEFGVKTEEFVKRTLAQIRERK
ncbi:MAG: threonine--tRNA ligase [Candidatus Diapherotrites archaeon]|uniref:Threonine--tRNA ligase n=1 Tax=Candidatus Iainarchaeum sp. TaxID=3101447 RepID=A0A8T3YMK5_9ARCH|nr:threonine--tRNA ligase [Candidatus Diapherotrites archaeon]